MFSVIFEVQPKQERFNDYLKLATHLKPLLENIDGFIDNERFEHTQRRGWLLSHSTWRDEKAVVRWRTVGEHHVVQEKGRDGIFADYHLRVGDVCYDSHPPAKGAVREQRLDETETGAAKWATLTEVAPQPDAPFAGRTHLLPEHLGLDVKDASIIDYGVFSSLYTPGKLALLVSWRTREGASVWVPHGDRLMQPVRHRTVRIVRDYGMFDRREAAQYYPPAAGAPERN